MRYRHREQWQAGAVHLSLRSEAEIEEGEFEVPSEDPELHRRLIDAGHEPTDPDALPEGVEYDPESGESGSESDPDTEPADDASDGDAGEEAANAEPEDAAPDVSPAEIGEMNRSELYALGTDGFGFDWDWAGDTALDAGEMRERLKEAI